MVLSVSNIPSFFFLAGLSKVVPIQREQLYHGVYFICRDTWHWILVAVYAKEQL